jgi:FdhE protein
MEVRAALEKAKAERPELRRTIALELELRALEAEAIAPPPPGFEAAARARLAAGLPAVDPATIELDWAAVARRVRVVCATVAGHEPRHADELHALAGRPAEDVRARAVAFLQSDPPPSIETLVLVHALRPFLRPFAEVALREASGWTSGHCPACGGAPDLAVLEGEGARRLLCGRCDSEWTHARVGCPFCGNQEQSSLAYFSTSGGRHRLYVCEQCHGYLKTLDRRETWETSALPAERVLAVGLDVAAAHAGYVPAGHPAA